MKELVIYDLDDTLLSGDSEFNWSKFLVNKGLLDKNTFKRELKAFEIDYRKGELNFEAYCCFLLNPLIGKSYQAVSDLVDEFISEYKKKLVDELSYRLLNDHKENPKLIASGALDFIVEGFAKFFNVKDFLGTKCELVDKKITGNIEGEPNFDQGKLHNVRKWCEAKGYNLKDVIFYTDSIHDLPMIKACRNSILISPDDKLRNYGEENNLNIITR